MSLLMATIILSLAYFCLLLWKCGLLINLVGTHRGIVSHVGALDMSHLLLLLDLAHVLLFFLQGEISHMMTLSIALEANDGSLVHHFSLLLDLAIVGLVNFLMGLDGCIG